LARKYGLDRLLVLKNFIKTYVGQAGTSGFGSFVDCIMRPIIFTSDLASKELGSFSVALTDHPPVTIQIDNYGTCTVMQQMNCSYVNYRSDGTRTSSLTLIPFLQLESYLYIPAILQMQLQYSKRLEEPVAHPDPDDCYVRGCILNVFKK
jgi:hypothetical protein